MQQQPSIKLVEMCGERPTERIKRRDTSTSNTTFCANPFEGRTSRVLFVTSTISERISVLPAQYSAITRLRSMLCSMSRVEAREAASCSECQPQAQPCETGWIYTSLLRLRQDLLALRAEEHPLQLLDQQHETLDLVRARGHA